MRGPTAVFVLALTCGLPGCGAFLDLARAESEAARYERAVAAHFDLDVDVLCTPEGALRLAPCRGRLALRFTNTETRESASARIPESGALHGDLPEGEYEIAVEIDEMRMGLAASIGRVHLDAGSQPLGRLHVHFVEWPSSTFEEDALHAELVRRALSLPTLDFVQSSTRGLLLIDAARVSP